MGGSENFLRCPGNPMRFRSGVVPIRLDDRWSAEMPRAKQHAVIALTRVQMGRYGYLGSSAR